MDVASGSTPYIYRVFHHVMIVYYVWPLQACGGALLYHSQDDHYPHHLASRTQQDPLCFEHEGLGACGLYVTYCL